LPAKSNALPQTSSLLTTGTANQQSIKQMPLLTLLWAVSLLPAGVETVTAKGAH
jgi:hypothetical protein